MEWHTVRGRGHGGRRAAYVQEARVEGDIILGGRYRIERLLYQRPRVNLYLGKAIAQPAFQPEIVAFTEAQEPLVAIRELMLGDLGLQIREQIEAAALEEFISPVVLGSSRLPTPGDRIFTEGDKSYLIMQLHSAKNERQMDALPLSDLLIQRQWPLWLNVRVTHAWGTQLCRIVARLHRLGVVLGDLDPATILVDSEGSATWSPVLLLSWPPAPRFWTRPSLGVSVEAIFAHVFPTAPASPYNAFVAPEMLQGKCDERSDVYSLGAILYLLYTHYAPMSAARRLRNISLQARAEDERDFGLADGLELIAPGILMPSIDPAVERIIVRALQLVAVDRYASVFELVEALEAAEQALGHGLVRRPRRWHLGLDMLRETVALMRQR